jgi:signal transduction histidine kinase
MIMHATLGRMSQQMAHDLRNPLGIMKGHTQALQVDLEQGVPIDARSLDPIVQQIDRMVRIIDDYRRIGRVEPELRSVDVNDVVREAIHDRETAKRLSPELPPCMADRDLLLIAIQNVMRNAREASDGRIEVVTEQTQKVVTISIIDRGPGMDPRTKERAFDDFFTTKATGSGLGLSFVRRVMEAHGGQVMLHSTIGKGTCVTLELPVVH